MQDASAGLTAIAFAPWSTHPTDSPASDSSTLADHRQWADPDDYPASSYPLHTDGSLRLFLRQLAMATSSIPTTALPILPEPSLYTLAAAMFWFGNGPEQHLDAALMGAGFVPADGTTSIGRSWRTQLLPELRKELRWRDCRSMGKNPSGPVRRGRLLQMAASFVTLKAVNASPLHQHKLVGTCPFCGERSLLQVFLRDVSWRCFACQRGGGLLEFADELLDAAASVLESVPRLP